MPLYPFILLAVIFMAVILLPPLLAAYLDYRREIVGARLGRDRARRSGSSGVGGTSGEPEGASGGSASDAPSRRDD